MSETLQGLPYKELGKGANRITIRESNKEVGATLSRETYMIPFDRIFRRDGFNTRDFLPNIEPMAKDMEANGLITPLTVDLVTGGEQGPIYYVEMGHRRYGALTLLKEMGLLNRLDLPGIRDGKVECFVNKTDVDELTRITRIFSSNHHEPLTPLEISRVCDRLKRYFNLPHAAIAARLGMSRQMVDNYILIANATDDVKEAIKGGQLKLTAAIELIRTVQDSTKQAEFLRESKETNRKVSVNDVKKLADAETDISADEFGGAGTGNEEDNDDDWVDADEEENGEDSGEPGSDYVDPDEEPVRQTEPFNPREPKPGEVLPSQAAMVQNFLDKSDPNAKEKEEYKLCGRVIGNLDKISTILTNAHLPDGTRRDVEQLLGWAIKDIVEIRDFVKKAKIR
jgi:hypothetical protein